MQILRKRGEEMHRLQSGMEMRVDKYYICEV